MTKKISAKRAVLWGVFAVSCLLALADLLFVRGLFTWMIAAPLVFVTGIANVAAALWKREGKAALLALLITVFLCGSYAVLLAWSLT